MITVEPYQGPLGKCWLTPDGKIYYGDRLAPTHVEVTPPPSADHTVYDDAAQEWKMSYMRQVEGSWVEDPELKAAYDTRMTDEANARITAVLAENDARCVRPAREFMAALLAETSNITAAETVSDLKAALGRAIAAIHEKIPVLDGQAATERAKLRNNLSRSRDSISEKMGG